MATVSFRVPDDLKERMESHSEVNWSAVLREGIARELDELEGRNVARAVLTSERLSQSVDRTAVADHDSTEVIRQWRDRRYGPDGEVG